MFQTNASNLIGGLFFGSIGFVAFIYGKRTNQWRTMMLGLALMAFPYFVESVPILYLLGTAGTITLFFLRG
jgi:hypothetical protein